eukprot:372189-Alexandrium_andersonii.AAC.1
MKRDRDRGVRLVREGLDVLVGVGLELHEPPPPPRPCRTPSQRGRRCRTQPRRPPSRKGRRRRARGPHPPRAPPAQTPPP